MNSKPNVAFFSPHATYPISFAAKAASLGNYNVFAVIPEKSEKQKADHFTCYSEILRDRKIEVVDPNIDLAINFSHIFILLSPIHFYDREQYGILMRWMSKAKRVSGISHFWPVKPFQNLKVSLIFLRDYFKLVSQLESVIYEEMPSLVDPISLRVKRSLLGIHAHPRYFHDRNIARILYCDSWKSTDIRSLKFNFLGTAAPQKRVKLLNEIKSFLSLNFKDSVSFVDSLNPNPECKINVLLRVCPNTVEGLARPRPHEEYLTCLKSSDFTICVPGYTVWSCRPVESLLSGSIPIMLEEEARNFYDFDLVHLYNSILVKGDNWIEAINTALSLSQIDLVRMRSNVKETKHQYLDIDVWSQRLRCKMGLK